MNLKYILDAAGRAVPEPDLIKWGTWFENIDNRRVAYDELPGGAYVSTIFLGLDHNHSADGPPILWETMIFGGPQHGECKRCAGNREQAEAMHAELLAEAKAALSIQH